jgi:hypothetical protein
VEIYREAPFRFDESYLKSGFPGAQAEIDVIALKRSKCIVDAAQLLDSRNQHTGDNRFNISGVC